MVREDPRVRRPEVIDLAADERLGLRRLGARPSRPVWPPRCPHFQHLHNAVLGSEVRYFVREPWSKQRAAPWISRALAALQDHRRGNLAAWIGTASALLIRFGVPPEAFSAVLKNLKPNAHLARAAAASSVRAGRLLVRDHVHPAVAAIRPLGGAAVTDVGLQPQKRLSFGARTAKFGFLQNLQISVNGRNLEKPPCEGKVTRSAALIRNLVGKTFCLASCPSVPLPCVTPNLVPRYLNAASLSRSLCLLTDHRPP